MGPDSDQEIVSEDETADEYEPLAVPPWVEWDREAYAWDPSRPCAPAPSLETTAGERMLAPQHDDAPAMP
eukprot:1014844-Alexandrium_andersonii.AAC.1